MCNRNKKEENKNFNVIELCSNKYVFLTCTFAKIEFKKLVDELMIDHFYY